MSEYITGSIFPSKGKIVIDTGKNEYPLIERESFELWNGTEFVRANLSDIKIPQMTGIKARILLSQLLQRPNQDFSKPGIWPI